MSREFLFTCIYMHICGMFMILFKLRGHWCLRLDWSKISKRGPTFPMLKRVRNLQKNMRMVGAWAANDMDIKRTRPYSTFVFMRCKHSNKGKNCTFNLILWLKMYFNSQEDLEVGEIVISESLSARVLCMFSCRGKRNGPIKDVCLNLTSRQSTSY